jgi:hypothetical protein
MAKGRSAALARAADRKGIHGWTPSDTRLRRQRQCETIWLLGARVLFELIDEVDHVHGADLDASLERYATLNPEILRVLRGDRMPALPIRLVWHGS